MRFLILHDLPNSSLHPDVFPKLGESVFVQFDQDIIIGRGGR